MWVMWRGVCEARVDVIEESLEARRLVRLCIGLRGNLTIFIYTLREILFGDINHHLYAILRPTSRIPPKAARSDAPGSHFSPRREIHMLGPSGRAKRSHDAARVPPPRHPESQHAVRTRNSLVD